MRKQITLSIITLVLFSIVNITKAQNLTPKLLKTIEAELESVFAKSLVVGENLDVAKIEESVDDKYKSGFIANGVYYTTFDSLMMNFKGLVKNISSQKYVIKHKKITVLSEKIGLITADGTATAFLASGESFSVKFAWTFIYKKINNDWKVINSHQSSSR